MGTDLCWCRDRPTIILAGDFVFPFGSAASARMRNLAAGLVDCGRDVLVVSLANSGRLAEPVFFAPHLSYFPSSALGGALRNRGLRGKLSWLASTYASGYSRLRQTKKFAAGRELEAVVLYGRSYVRLLPFLRFGHCQGVPVVLDCVEILESFAGFGAKLSPIYWDWWVGSHRLPKLVSGATVITRGLERQMRSRGCHEVIVVPSIEDFSGEAATPPHTDHREFRLVYVGAMLPRDNPGFVVAMARALCSGSVPVTIELVGKFDQVAEAAPYLAAIRSDASLAASIRVVGMVDDAELAQRIATADGLLLPRRDAPAEENAFPTRLVEFLRTGRPVFVCSVGDVALYLRDGIDAILLDPSDPTRAARRIAEVAGSADRGAAIGEQGRRRGAECFDRKVHASRLLNLFQRIHAQ